MISTNTQQVIVAGGCFWCLDAAYRVLEGVIEVESVYTGGHDPHPTYEAVCTGTTGHAEAVRITFDGGRIPEQVILDAFFTMHDPTQLNRQGADIGTQYRSAMFYVSDEQRERFEVAKIRASEWWPNEIVTEITPVEQVFVAEEYHQDFFAKNPTQAYCLAVALPKVNKVRAGFAQYVKPMH